MSDSSNLQDIIVDEALWYAASTLAEDVHNMTRILFSSRVIGNYATLSAFGPSPIQTHSNQETLLKVSRVIHALTRISNNQWYGFMTIFKHFRPKLLFFGRGKHDQEPLFYS